MRMNGEYPLTGEQNNAVDLFATGGSLKVDARAGAGKTSTLVAMAKEKPVKKGLYVAFNKSIADDAGKRFPNSVMARTAHSLAFREVGVSYKRRLEGRLTGRTVAETFNLQDNDLLTAAAMGNLLISYVTRFCNSSDSEITKYHAPLSSMTLPIEDEAQAKAMKYQIADELLPYAKRLWNHLTDLNQSLPITHDVYLKLWVMGKPRLKYDYILADEAQDLNPVLIQLLESQARHAQLVYVGDPYQQIYSWRGAQNAMRLCNTDNEAVMSQSFRFGKAIANVGMAVLKDQLDADVLVRGFDKISSTVETQGKLESPSAILCRTNKMVIQSVIDMLHSDKNVHVVGGVSDTINLLYGVRDLQANTKTTCPELAAFKNWYEVREFANTDAGMDLKVLVNLVKDHGSDYLIATLSRVKNIREHDADIIISTAHKSKGREWDYVSLTDDFKHPETNPKGWAEEDANLLYVATTRAKHILDISSCRAALDALKH